MTWINDAFRLAVLALIDVSSFPAANIGYAAPANYMAVVAAFLSIAALVVKPRPA